MTPTPSSPTALNCSFAGREIANGFSELNDPEDQAERFRRQAERKRLGCGGHALRSGLHHRLEHGLPPTAGEGIGVDRLVMLLTGFAIHPRRAAVSADAPGAHSVGGA